MEAPVGAERIALAREHAGRVLVLALEMEYAGRERELARQVLAHAPAHELAVIFEPRQRHFRHLGAGKRGAGEPRAQLLAAYLDDLLVAGIRLHRLRPAVDELLRLRSERRILLLDDRSQLRYRFAQH